MLAPLLPRMLAWVRARRADLALGGVAIVLLLPTLSYRYGIDQALYHYVGSGWLHGHIPYRDAFDVKPPAIYALYAFAILLLGPSQSSIRVLELCCVLAVGWAAARATHLGGEDRSAAGASRATRADGIAGLSAIVLAGFYAFGFGFWDTGQVELWEGAFVVFAYAALPADPRRTGRFALSGALACVALLFKVTAALPVAVLGLFASVTAARGERAVVAKVRRGLLAAAGFTAGFGAPVALVCAYFALHGAFGDLREWFGYLPQYARAPVDPVVTALGPETLLLRGGVWYGVAAAIWVVGISEARRARAPGASSGAVLALALFVAAVLGVAIQRRYYSYHTAVLGPFLSLMAVHGFRVFVAVRRTAVTGLAMVCVTAGALLTCAPWTGSGFMTYREFVWHSWLPHVFGRTTDAELDAAFEGAFGYSYRVQVDMAKLVEGQRPRPGDMLHVSGFDTMLYVLTNMRTPSRFMIDIPIDNPYLTAYRPSWVTEHRRVLAEHPPRFFIIKIDDVARAEALRAQGWGFAGSRGRYALLDREQSATALTPDAVKHLLAGSAVSGTVVSAFAFSGEFREDGTVQGRVGEGADSGTFRVSRHGELCIRWRTWLSRKEHCALLFARAGQYALFERGGRELGTITLVTKQGDAR